MSMIIQKSVGYGSMGMVYVDIPESEIEQAVEQTARVMRFTPELVRTKLSAGGTMWLSRADEQKIRGYDSAAELAREEKQESDRASRRAADGYFVNL